MGENGRGRGREGPTVCHSVFLAAEAVAFLLFALCDTVIRLQVASGGYLTLGEGLRRFLFMDFNLSWLFYLPSQVLLSLDAGKYREMRNKK